MMNIKGIGWFQSLVPTVIFNPILRASTGILSPSVVVTYTKCSRQADSQIYKSDDQIHLKVSNLSFYVSYIGGISLYIPSIQTHCHLQSLNSPRIDKDTDSHFDFLNTPSAASSQIYKSEDQINLKCQVCHSMWHILVELVYSNHPKPTIIFNSWSLRGSTGILSSTYVDILMHQVQQAVESISLRIG